MGPLLDDCKGRVSTWEEYERRFLDLISQRRIEAIIPRDALDNSVLLCSEPTPHYCHRRLVVEYLADRWGCVQVTHL